MVLKPHTLDVNIPSNGRPVLVTSTDGRVPFIFRPTVSVRIGSLDSVSSDSGLLLYAGSLFGLGAADFSESPENVSGYIYACTAEPGNGGKIKGICWKEG